MKLSIIVVNYFSWGHLEKALNALQEDFPPDWELIVVDNESQPATLTEFAARFPWVRFVPHAHNSGFGFGCNLGVAEASGTLLLFMNPDVIATRAEIEALIEERRTHPDAAIIAPRQLDSAGRPQKVFDDFPSPANQVKFLKALLRLIAPSRYLDPRAGYDSLVYCDWVTGSCLLMSRADFDLLGGWSEDYWMYAEDADLCRRAHNAGLRVAYTPKVQVIHAHGGSSRINVAVKSMTKLEVIISKHVYAQRHFFGARRWLMHILIGLVRLPGLLLAVLADLVTLKRIPALSVRSRILAELASYYRGVLRTGSWLSPRAAANARLRREGAQPE